MSQLGLLLRDAALLRTREGREEAIRLVREHLHSVFWRRQEVAESVVPSVYGKRLERNDVPWDCSGPPSTFRATGELTADDVQEAVDVLFGETKERRWTANVLVGWDRVRVTDRVVRSRRPVNHGRRVAVW